MTTKLIIKNAASSNGDVNVRVKSGSHVQPTFLTPGQSVENWISTAHEIEIDETWPTKTPASAQVVAGELADSLITTEVAIQDKMWGDANERADSTDFQLLAAGCAQANALFFDRIAGASRENAFASAKHGFYPDDWEGFRDYGSDVANLVVAVAFLRSEIKRRILLGEDITRTKRGEPYTKADPLMSSEEAAALVTK